MRSETIIAGKQKAWTPEELENQNQPIANCIDGVEIARH